MRKRFIALLTSLILLISLFPVALVLAAEEDGISEDSLAGTLTIAQGNQKLVFTQNAQGQYEMTSFVRATDADPWLIMFDGQQPIVSGSSFDLYPTSYEIISNAAEESSVLFSGVHPKYGYAWDVLVTRDAASSFFGFTITCHLTSSLQLNGLEPKFAFWLNQEGVESQLSQGPDSIYWSEDQRLTFNEYSLGFPAAYLCDAGREAALFVDATPMTWMGRENVNGFDDARVRVFSENGQTGIGFDVITRTGNTIPPGDMVTQLYLYTGCTPETPSGLDALDRLIRICAPLHPSTAELPENRYGDPMTWAFFAEQSIRELHNSRNWETRDFNLQDTIVPEEDREGAPFITGLARPNAKGGFDFSTTNNWLSAWLIYEQLNPDASQADFLRQKVDGLASFYDPEADMIRWGVRQQNTIGDLEMSWQNQFYNVETLRAYESMRDSDFHPAILANLLDGTDSLTQLLQNSDYLLPQWYNPYLKEGVVQNDVPVLGYIKEPWQIGSYAYIFMKCYEITQDEEYAALAKTALDQFFASSYSMENDVYSKTYDDPSEFPVTELFGNAYGSVAASMLQEYTGDETYAKYSNYFLDVLLRLTFWYDDNGDEASLTLNTLGLFLPHGGAYNACSWENAEAYVPLTSVVKNSADEDMTTLLAKLYNLSRINSFHFYPATWSPVFAGQLGYNEENKYQPTEPLYLSIRGGNADYGALYMASLAPYNYLMFEAFGTTDDNDILLLNLDNFDNLPLSLQAAERNFLLYNPTEEERQTTVTYSHLPVGDSFLYTESDVNRRQLKETTYSAQELLEGAVTYTLQPGEILRISFKNTDPAVQAHVVETAEAKSNLSLAYQKVRQHLQGTFAQKLTESYPTLSNDTVQTISRYVGSLVDYDTAISLLQASLNRGDSADAAVTAMKQAFIDREACDVQPDVSLQAPAYLEKLVTDLNVAVATFQGGNPALASQQAQAILDTANAQNTLTQVVISSSSITYQPGQEGTIEVQGFGTDGSVMDLTEAKISYASDAESIVSMDTTPGTFTAHAPGQALLTATVTLKDVVQTGYLLVEVSQAPTLTSATAIDSSTVQLAWEAGAFPLSGIENYVIYRDGQEIATLPSTSFTYQDTLLQGDRSYSYQVMAVNPQGIQTALSNALVATTPANTTPPQVYSVTANQDTTTVLVRFLEAVDPKTAQDPKNYEISDGIVVESATLDASRPNEVVLGVSGMRYNHPYELTVSAIANTSGIPTLMPDPQTLSFRYLPDLISYWDFEEGRGDAALDVSGNNNALALTGTEWAEGYLGTALSFDTTASGKIEQAVLPLKDHYTISAWIQTPNTRPAEKTVLTIGEAGTSSYLRVLESFDGQMLLDTPATGYRGGAIQVDTDTWRHIAVANNGSQILWYTDGALTYTWDVNSTFQSDVLPIILGNQADGKNGFQGCIDEVRIYDRVLSDTEIAHLYTTVPVTDITLPETLKLNLGESTVLEPVILPSHATHKAVTWTSSDADIVQVDVKGRITALSPGQATITATTVDGNFTASTTVVVADSVVSVTGVSLDKAPAELEEGNSLSLVATVAPENATNKKVTWTSSDEKVATVDASGKVTAVKAGNATITVTTEDGQKTATCVVTVKEKAPVTVPVTGVTLDKATAELEEGNSLSLVATVAPENATNKNVTWTSSDEKVATVDASGKVTAVKAGSATITVTTEDGQKTATCVVTVKEKAPVTVPVTGVTLDKATAELLEGNSLSLVATVAPENATNKKVSWTSSDEKVATVDASGKVTAVKAGSATITVTTEDGQKTAACVVTVKAKPAVEVPVEKLKISPYSVRVFVGEALDLDVEVTPANASVQDVTWISDNPEVATVDQNGYVVTKAEGVARIYAEAKDGSGVTCYRTVTVYGPLVSNLYATNTQIERNSWENTRITYNLNYKALVDIEILNAKGQVVRTLRDDLYVGAANGRYATWNLKDNNGQYVPAGKYTARVSVELPTGELSAAEETLVQVVDPAKARISKYTVNASNRSATISYTLNTKAAANFYVYNADGKLVFTKKNVVSPAGTNTYAWDYRDSKGNRLPAGRYQVNMYAWNSLGKSTNAYGCVNIK